MFKPNRVGTPHIFTGDAVDSAANFTLATNLIGAVAQPANVINAAPYLDFGQYTLNWNGTESLPAGEKCAFAHQFVITEPLAGNTVALELAATIRGTFPDNAIIRPFIAKILASTSAVLEGVTSFNVPISFGRPALIDGITGGAVFRAHHYKEQILVSSSGIAGAYIHGFEIDNVTGGAVNITQFKMDAQIRQLNDQQSIGYRDTLR